MRLHIILNKKLYQYHNISKVRYICTFITIFLQVIYLSFYINCINFASTYKIECNMFCRLHTFLNPKKYSFWLNTLIIIFIYISVYISIYVYHIISTRIIFTYFFHVMIAFIYTCFSIMPSSTHHFFSNLPWFLLPCQNSSTSFWCYLNIFFSNCPNYEEKTGLGESIPTDCNVKATGHQTCCPLHCC